MNDTVEDGISRTVSDGLARMRRIQVSAAPFDAVPIDGNCAGARYKSGKHLGLCFSCANWGFPDGKMQPRVEFGGVAACLDHAPVHGGVAA